MLPHSTLSALGGSQVTRDQNPKAKVLIVEDETDIRELLTLHMERSGFEVSGAVSGDEALEKLNTMVFDLIVLDWMLPQISGIEVLRQIRAKSQTAQIPVLMLTAKSTASDIVLGLESGADDYVTKPFEPVVLLARARSLLRRTMSPPISQAQDVQVLVLGDLVIDPRSYSVSYQGKAISLTLSEFKLLHALTANRGRVLTRDQLIELVQGEGVAVIDRAIDTHVFGLRKKLGDVANFIETVRGVGYRIHLGV
jgi:two-component system, OmpR family, phosphate regulon response regulator PhoB